MKFLRKYFTLRVVFLAVLTAATFWKIGRRSPDRNAILSLTGVLPTDVCVVVAFSAPPKAAPNDKVSTTYREAQRASLSYLFNGFETNGVLTDLRDAGIDADRPILLGAIGRLGLAPQRIRQGDDSFASIPHDWFALVPVTTFLSLTAYFETSLKASISRDEASTGSLAISSIVLPAEQPTFALPENSRNDLAKAIGKPLPVHSRIHCAELSGLGYVALSTSQACLIDGLGSSAEGHASKWHALLARLQSEFGRQHGIACMRVTPLLFPQWKNLIGHALFTDQSIVASGDMEVGGAVATFFAPEPVSFSPHTAVAHAGIDSYIETAPVHLKQLVGDSAIESFAREALDFNQDDGVALERFAGVLHRLLELARGSQPAQVFFTRGQLGSPGWAFSIPVDPVEATKVATDIQHELTKARANADLTAMVESLSESAITSLNDKFATKYFHIPVPLILANVPEIDPRLQRWSNFAVELNSRQVVEPAEAPTLFAESHLASVDGLAIQLLIPPNLSALNETEPEPSSHSQATSHSHPCFYIEPESRRLFIAESPRDLSTAVRYTRNFFPSIKIGKPHQETIARFTWDVASFAEQSVVATDDDWLRWFVKQLARVEAQTASGDLKLHQQHLKLAVSISL